MASLSRDSLRRTGLWDETGSTVNVSRSTTPNGSTFDIPQLYPVTQNSNNTSKRNSFEVPSLKRASSILEEDEVPPPPVPTPSTSGGLLMRNQSQKRESRPPSMRPATYAAVQKHTGAWNNDSVKRQDDKTSQLESTIKTLTSTVDQLQRKLDNYMETQTELQTYRLNQMGNGQGTLGTLGKASAISAPAMHMPKAFRGPDYSYGTNPFYHQTEGSVHSAFPGTMSSHRSGRPIFGLGRDMNKSTEKLKDWDELENDRAVDWSRDENETRGNFSWRTDGIFSLLAYTAGLAHIWRFPFLFHKYGGAVFLIPYFIMLVLMGMPLVFLELALGQYSSNGILSCWNFAPMVKGIGWGMFIMSTLVAVYYNVFIAWSAHYLVMSFTSLPGVPWSSCKEEWQMQDCFTQTTLSCSDIINDVNNTLSQYMGYINTTYGDPIMQCTTDINGTLTDSSSSLKFIVPGEGFVLPAKAFFANEILHLFPSIDLGQLRWETSVALLAVWIIVFLCLIKGIKSSAKAAYVTVIGPYFLMVILLIIMCIQTGALEGIRTFYQPDINKLQDVEAWRDAAIQVGLTLMTGWGGLITLASYNRFHYNCFWNVWVVVLFNIVTALLLGTLVFACIGIIVNETELNIYQIVESGPGFIFVVMSESIARVDDSHSSGVPHPPALAVLTFLMFMLFGIGTQCGIVETITTGIFDAWPTTRKKKKVPTATLR